MPKAPNRLELLSALSRKVLWLSSWTIHHANHIRPNADGLKVGGHQASSASLVTIMSALYFSVLRPQDRVAVKPHASAVFHAIQYLFGRQSRARLENFRGFKGAQSYPSRTKDVDDVDFSTGSVGLGVAQTLFSSLVQDYVTAHGWMKDRPEGRMIALVGDAEMDEGNIFEALLEGWKHGLRNTWWVVDYNRQSLDAVVREGLWEKFESMFRNFGWDVVIVKYGRLMQAAFAEPGGAALRNWIDTCPNQMYAALCFQGGAAFRKRLNDEIGDQGEVSRLIDARSDDELLALMSNLGGHDMASMVEAFEAIDHDRPVCFIAYTIKGVGLPFQGHKDNHAGLMTPTQMETLRAAQNIRPGHEWDRFEGLEQDEATLQAFLDAAPINRGGDRKLTAPVIEVPSQLSFKPAAEMSTQQGFGLILNELARGDSDLAARIVTASPDVTVSTNLGAWVNRRGLFARAEKADLFRSEKIPTTFNWDFSPKGQHLELGIAEMNLFILMSALGLSHAINGERLLPIATLYDPFIQRGLDALNYACYQDARFMVVATPSGITLAPEGGAHQSIATPLIGIAQDGLAAFEPGFVDELAVIMRWGFAHMQREASEGGDARSGMRAGGSVYLRLSTRSIAQPQRVMTPQLQQAITDGGYWLRPPGPNCELVIAYTGALAPEAIEAVGLLGDSRRDVGLLAITSADRLHAGWTAARRLRRERRGAHQPSHIEQLLAPLPRDCGIVTVLDGHPATLGWIGAVCGHRMEALGVEHFGQTGSIGDLYRHYGLDANAIIDAAEGLVRGAPVLHRKMAV
ncbi:MULTISPECIES: 1-deoxy-D-xylulose-5-phosphate synthase N-terminal domain-containing protein [Rhodopseudomonas]|uniref:Pyruvate dehydrogenase E1 component n=1 Tax=Rhodopseudomonas palustris TaxID=1076 RepID=A0A0D7E456_RHOPL|nr:MULTISPECIES: 1-deoxy-D-xylulose-5-phosphate synthase N-terminal domain-containing protein [Rhodopseudomonas]KIZ35190.1 transketolase [Rhodopseudomonas palustris]MDF3813805.1 1-deoxy-D-xylulose-5-phosphate synthase N-terminal domain-containing protein [Rhodopseudomonas sp. BAL398]WOK19676.1 1-deoxy-D-xylulose-5-phosphate synthase N-terminal domain-containing protein [Rhodopseudomonas sp. BAL398]